MDILEEIGKTFPCRRQQLELLCALLGNNKCQALPSLFLYGHTATGKTSALKLVLKKLQHVVVSVNCVESYSSRILFETILGQLCVRDEINSNSTVSCRCENMNDFIRLLKQTASTNFCDRQCIYIIFERAERLRDSDPNILPAVLRLQELSGLNIGVVLESEIVWEKFRCGTGFQEPFVLYFSDYNKDELLEILSLDTPVDCPPDTYRNYVGLLLNVFHLVCHNLNELHYLASVNFSKYTEPVRKGEASFKDTHKLWRNVEPHLKKSLQTVYLREISGSQWEKMQQSASDSTTQNLASLTRSSLELPVYTKYLLIAAYLASYNPAKTDRRFFSKNCGKSNKRLLDAAKKKQERTTCQLLGPKFFPLDRLMAIFYSIVEDRVAPTANTFSQISSLVTLGFITQVSGSDILESPKYKCLVTLEFIKSIARSVGFEILRYLYDFL